MNNFFKQEDINYKDFLIITAGWYFITLSSYYIYQTDFASLIYINKSLSFTINILSHAVFLFIIYSYFNLLYDFSYRELGFNFKTIKDNFKYLAIIFSFLTAGVLLINFSSKTTSVKSFFPLILKENFLKVIYSDLPLIILIFLLLLFTAAVEQFLFNKIIFSLFDLYFPRFFAVILTALFAPILVLEFNPGLIAIIFLAVIISNYLYILDNYNLITPIIFYSYFLTLYIVFIYGFDFILIKL